MRFNLLVVLISCIFTFQASAKKRSQKETFNLKGNVESVLSTKYNASVDSLGQVIKGEYYIIRLDNIYEINLVSFKTSSFPENSLVNFDNYGEIRYILYFDKNQYKLLYAVEFASKTDLEQYEIIYGGGSRYEIKVNSPSFLPISKQLITLRNDTIIANYIYLNDRVIKDEFYMNSKLVSSITYNYNQKEQVANIYFVINNNDTIQNNNYTYNNNGDIENDIEKSRIFITKRKYEYKYDSKSNWIVKYEYVDEKLKSITERELRYY